MNKELEIYRKNKKQDLENELEILIATIDDAVMVFTAFMFPTSNKPLDFFFEENL